MDYQQKETKLEQVLTISKKSQNWSKYGLLAKRDKIGTSIDYW